MINKNSIQYSHKTIIILQVQVNPNYFIRQCLKPTFFTESQTNVYVSSIKIYFTILGSNQVQALPHLWVIIYDFIPIQLFYLNKLLKITIIKFIKLFTSSLFLIVKKDCNYIRQGQVNYFIANVFGCKQHRIYPPFFV